MTHAQSGMSSYFDRVRIFVRTHENDWNTLRVHAPFLGNGKKSLCSKISGQLCTGLSDDYIQ